MINKENADNTKTVEVPKESGYIDTARFDVYGHILIKDKDTGEVLVNKRG